MRVVATRANHKGGRVLVSLINRLLLVVVVVLAYALGARIDASLPNFAEFTLVTGTYDLLFRVHLFLLLDLLYHCLALQIVGHHTLLGRGLVAAHFFAFIAHKAHFCVLLRLHRGVCPL